MSERQKHWLHGLLTSFFFTCVGALVQPGLDAIDRQVGDEITRREIHRGAFVWYGPGANAELPENSVFVDCTITAAQPLRGKNVRILHSRIDFSNGDTLDGSPLDGEVSFCVVNDPAAELPRMPDRYEYDEATEEENLRWRRSRPEILKIWLWNLLNGK